MCVCHILLVYLGERCASVIFCTIGWCHIVKMLIAALLAVTPSAVSSTSSPRPNQWCAVFSHIFQDMSRVADILNKNAQLVLMSLPPPLASVRLLRVKNTQSEVRFFRNENCSTIWFHNGSIPWKEFIHKSVSLTCCSAAMAFEKSIRRWKWFTLCYCDAGYWSHHHLRVQSLADSCFSKKTWMMLCTGGACV